MKTILITLAFVSLSKLTFAQNFIGAFFEPSIQFTTIADAPEAHADSLQAINRPDVNFGLGIEFRLGIDRFNSISINPSYQQLSSQFVKEDLQFLDVVHPALPEIRDLSQGAIKNAYIHDRFKYLGLHVHYNRSISDRFKSIGVLFEANMGVSYHYLIQQDAKVVTEGFAIQEKFVHAVEDSLFFTGNKHNVSLSLGGSASYNFTSTWQVFGNALARVPIFTISTNDPRIRNYQLGFRAGIRVAIN